MSSSEKPKKENKENTSVELNIDDSYRDFIPEEFKKNPKEYIEKYGENIKSGEVKFDAEGNIREDPTATKFLELKDKNGNAIKLVSKKVNLEKVITKTEEKGEKFIDPFLEYKMMHLCKLLGLPTAEPVAFIKQGDDMYTLMKRVEGYTWTDRDRKELAGKGFTKEDEERIKGQIIEKMKTLEKKFDEFGVYRKWKSTKDSSVKWKYKDMVFRLDETGNVSEIIPVDWERSHVDASKIMEKIRDKDSGFSKKQLQKIRDILSLGIKNNH